MGTRGAVGFRVDGVDRVVYNHSDSYPEGLGHSTLEFVVEQNVNHRGNLVPALAEQARKMIPVEEDAVPTPEQIKELERFTDRTVNGGKVDFYSVLRKTQGHLDLMLEARYYAGNEGFLLDGLFCEHAYIINLDSGMLEYYSGFVTMEHADKADKLGRYWHADVLQKQREEAGGKPVEYGPVALCAEFPLGDINKVEDVEVYVKRMSAAYKALRVMLKEDDDDDE
jgi:hypothetical protein